MKIRQVFTKMSWKLLEVTRESRSTVFALHFQPNWRFFCSISIFPWCGPSRPCPDLRCSTRTKKNASFKMRKIKFGGKLNFFHGAEEEERRFHKRKSFCLSTSSGLECLGSWISNFDYLWIETFCFSAAKQYNEQTILFLLCFIFLLFGFFPPLFLQFVWCSSCELLKALQGQEIWEIL